MPVDQTATDLATAAVTGVNALAARISQIERDLATLERRIDGLRDITGRVADEIGILHHRIDSLAREKADR